MSTCAQGTSYFVAHLLYQRLIYAPRMLMVSIHKLNRERFWLILKVWDTYSVTARDPLENNKEHSKLQQGGFWPNFLI